MDGKKTVSEERLGTALTLLDCLSAVPYDELIEYDLINNRYHLTHHTEGKYFLPVTDGSLEAALHFAAENMVHPDDREKLILFLDPHTMQERLNRSVTPGMLTENVRYKLMDGSWNWTRCVLVCGEIFGLPDGIARQYVYDIQSEKAYEEQRRQYLSGDAILDERTGLPSNQETYLRLRKKIARIQGEWSLISIGIEHFKLLNDWHGQEKADRLLAAVGTVLRRTEQDVDGLAGYRGHGEFWLLIPYDLRMINELYEELRTLIVEKSGSVGFLPIFGICMVTSRDEVSKIIHHAALAAEQVKGDLHNRIRIYNPAIYDQTADEFRLLTDFRRALEEHEVFFCLQPQCRVSTGKVVGAESLARWRLRDGRMVPPTKFVGILEKYGMVTNLDQYIWEEVCKWMSRWRAQGYEPVPVSVNVSPTDILTIDVPDFFAMLLKKYGLPAELLKVEITESAYVEDTALTRNTVRRLRAMGMKVLMDDFGSGYSSLNMLGTINVDILKLDAQFLHISKHSERKGISILESVINMAKSMALPIIVEGVEAQEQVNFLEDLGCCYIQGYYFYRPLPVEEFERLIADERRVDRRGIEFKSNQQIHPREFLDENIFTDAMLNNVLGPVAIYRWKGDAVDIVRYNQQFFLMVGITIQQINDRRSGIQAYVHPDDRKKLYKILETATRDHMNGGKGVVRVYRPNGSIRWISMQTYFMNETEEGKTFYGSCDDVTEMQFINVDLPGGYHRVTLDENMEFRYVSRNFQDMTGYSESDLLMTFEGKFINMVHPDDVGKALGRMYALKEGKKPEETPFRIRHKEKGYIYVMDQQIVTDLYGEICMMGIAVDVSESMKLRDSMRLLTDYFTDCVAFVRHEGEKWDYELAAYGLGDKLGLDQEAFRQALNSGAFYSWVDESQRDELYRKTLSSIKTGERFQFSCDLILPSGRKQRIQMYTDRVEKNDARVEYICVFHAI